VDHERGQRAQLLDERLRERRERRADVVVAAHRPHRREPRERLQHLRPHEVARVQHEVAAGEQRLELRVVEPVGVGDEADAEGGGGHAPILGAGPPARC